MSQTFGEKTSFWNGYMVGCWSPRVYTDLNSVDSGDSSLSDENLPDKYDCDNVGRQNLNQENGASVNGPSENDDDAVAQGEHDSKKKNHMRKSLLQTFSINKRTSAQPESRVESSTSPSPSDFRCERSGEDDPIPIHSQDVTTVLESYTTDAGTAEQTTNTEQVWKTYWNSMSASGIWTSTTTDDVSISSDNISNVSFDSTDRVITEDKADLSAVGDGDSICCSTKNYDKPQVVRLRDDDDVNEETKKQFPSRLAKVPSILKIEKKKEAIKGALFQTNYNDLSRKIRNESPKLKLSSERVKKALLKKLKTTISSKGRYHTEVGNVLSDLAEFHREQNQKELSQTLFGEALSIYCASYGDYNDITIETKMKIAGLYRDQKNFDQAICMYNEVLSMQAALNGQNNMTVANTRVSIAETLYEVGQFKHAIKEMKEALKIFRLKYGDENVVVASLVEKIAHYYSCAKDDKKANLIYEELVKLRVSIHGTNALEVGQALMKWAKSFGNLGDVDQAVKLMKQAYLIFHEMGTKELDDANALQALGKIYSQKGCHDKAVKAYESSLLIIRRKHGDNEVTTAVAYVTLAIGLRAVNRCDKAMKSLNRAMTIYGESTDKKKHTSATVAIIHEIGVTYHEMGKYQLALRAFFREHSIRMKLLSDEEYELARCIRRIGLVYFELQKYEAARNFLFESLACFDRSIGRTAEFAGNLYDCARVFQKLKQQAEAAECYIEALLILKANGKTKQNDPIMHGIQNLLDSKIVFRLMHDVSEASLYCGLLDKKKQVQ